MCDHLQQYFYSYNKSPGSRVQSSLGALREMPFRFLSTLLMMLPTPPEPCGGRCRCRGPALGLRPAPESRSGLIGSRADPSRSINQINHRRQSINQHPPPPPTSHEMKPNKLIQITSGDRSFPAVWSISGAAASRAGGSTHLHRTYDSERNDTDSARTSGFWRSRSVQRCCCTLLFILILLFLRHQKEVQGRSVGRR